MTKFKQIIKYFILSIIDKFVKRKINVGIGCKRLLLVRVDAIGDYILFRNYIRVIRKVYPNYEITMVGNIAWRSISEEFDGMYIDKFIWIDRIKFERNLIYRYKKLNEVAMGCYEILMNPTYSRTFFVDDAIIKVVEAKEKIGSIGDLSNMTQRQKKISDRYYTMLLPAKSDIIFEFYRNKEFFENLLNKKIDLKRPFINLKNKNIHIALPEKYAVLFIGASNIYRKWSISNFVKTGKYLKEEYNYEIVLCGGPTEMEDSKAFGDMADYLYIDMVGKSSLVDLLYIIHGGDLMVSNETSAPHLAVALGMANIFVISNGNHYGRFTPYPSEVCSDYHPIYHPEIENRLYNDRQLIDKFGQGSDLDINEITTDMVIQKINSVFFRS